MPSLLRRPTLAVLCSLTVLLPALSAAQPEAVQQRAPTSGIALPPTSAALADEATAPAINPAGLGLLAGPSLFYLHERDPGLDLTADGLFVGLGFGGLSLGFSPQWIRPGGSANYSKTQWTLALGSEVFAIGASLNVFGSSHDEALDDLTTWDVGLMLRPSRFLSFGASALDVDDGRLNGQRLPRRYDLALGVRPFTDRVELAADWLVDDTESVEDSRLTLVLRGELIEGLNVRAGGGHDFDNGDWFAQVGLEIDAPRFGVGYAYGDGEGHSGGDHLAYARLSAERYRGLPVGRRRFVIVDLARALSEPDSHVAQLLGATGPDPYLKLLEQLRHIREDDSVAGVLVKLEGAPIGFGRAEELRNVLVDLKSAGKRVVAYFMQGEDSDYLIATAADRIFAAPQGAFLVNGLSTSTTFVGAALQRLGVEIDVARVGEYKSAPEQLTRNDMSQPEREMLDAYLDSVFPRLLEAVSKSRNIPEQQLREAIDRGILSAQLAQQAGLVDAVIYPDELTPKLQELAGGSVELVDKYEGAADWPRRWGTRPKIAVLSIEGLIAEGRSRPQLLGEPIAGAETIVRALDKVLKDDGIEALVLRIDSGGGSTLASDLIWRAVGKVKERKPVVVSMGDVAASGGYYIAVAGNEILAEPGTVTGSIGVFALKPSFGPLFGKIGFNTVVLKRGESADLFSLSRTWTEQERKAVQGYVDEAYQVFLDRVAQGRGLDKKRVDELGRGRIWSGADAKELGLVDALGGLPEAIERARSRAGLAGKEIDVELLGGAGLFEGSLFTTGEDRAQVQRLLERLGAANAAGLIELQDRPLSLMPWTIEVR